MRLALFVAIVCTQLLATTAAEACSRRPTAEPKQEVQVKAEPPHRCVLVLPPKEKPLPEMISENEKTGCLIEIGGESLPCA